MFIYNFLKEETQKKNMRKHFHIFKYEYISKTMCHTTPPTKTRHGFKYFTQINSSLVKFSFIPVKSR